MKIALTSLYLLFAAGDPDSAAPTIQKFYQTYSEMKTSGLPDAAGMAKLSPYFSSSLKKLILSAQANQARCRKAHPGDKPPWTEGDMFSSNLEGFTKFHVVGAGPAKGGRSVYKVAFEYAEKGQRATAWPDEVAVVREAGRWVIDDVFYRRKSAFGNGFGPALRDGLAANGCP